MKVIVLVFLSLVVSATVVNAQSSQPKTHLDSLYVKYPLQPSNQCGTCLLWVNPYFKAIIDTKMRESVVTFAVYTASEDSTAEKLNLDRTGTNAEWHPFFGYPSETKFYNDINKTLVKPDEYAKGHYSAWTLNAYAQDAVLLSDTYDFNEGIERQAQNEGTEFQVENLTRALVGNANATKAMKYTGPTFPAVQYWKGSWGSFQVFTLDGISKNYSAVYWNLIKYGNELHAFWFPNDTTATAKVGYQHYEIPVSDLVSRLGFDPQTVLQ